MPLGVQGRNNGSAVFLAMLPTLTAWNLWGKEDPKSIIQVCFILVTNITHPHPFDNR